MGPRRRGMWQRMIEAAIEIFATKGFINVKISDISDGAGINRTQFYFLFEDKEECFISAQMVVLSNIEERLREVVPADGEWLERMKIGVDTLLDLLSEEPNAAKLLLVETPVAGDDARKQMRAALQQLLPIIGEGRKLASPSLEVPVTINELALGGAVTLLSQAVQESEDTDLRLQAPHLLFALIVPYVGPEEALEHARALYGEVELAA